jgi:protein ImuB
MTQSPQQSSNQTGRPANRQILSIALIRLSTDRLRQRFQRLPAVADRSAEKPLVTVVAVNGRRLIDGLDYQAELAGLRPGMALADAHALVSDLVARDADPAADRRCLEDLADWCGRYAPWTAAEPVITQGQGGIWMDVTGSTHLFGGPEAMLADLLMRLRKAGYCARAALGPTAGAAWALARYAREAAEQGVAFAEDGRALRDRLAQLPVSALRLDADVVRLLERFGLERIGALQGMARGPLVARFGRRLALRLDQMFGRVEEPISPRRPVAPHRAQLSFAEPLATTESLSAALERMIATLCGDMEQAGKGARRLEAALWRVDGAVRRIGVGAHRPLRDPTPLARLLLPHLDKLDVGFGIETIVLSAPIVEPLGARQQDAFAHGDESAVDSLIDRLVDRLGPENVLRSMPNPSALPERAELQLAVGDAPTETPSLFGDAPAPHRKRPIRLFTRPEPIEAVSLLPDQPPRQFSWRGGAHRVRRAEGPERIAPEWWRAKPNAEGRTRDYYRVEDDQGRRFWVFRAGLYEASAGSATGETAPRWYMHGLFA